MKAKAEYLCISESAPLSLLKRLRGLMDRAAVTGTPWAMMRLQGELSEGEYDACEWFHALHARYQRALDVRGVKPQGWEAGSKGEPPDPFSEAGMRLSKAERDTVAEFRSAELAGMGAGIVNYRDFLNVVIGENEPTNLAHKGAVCNVARALAKHRGMGSRFRRGAR